MTKQKIVNAILFFLAFWAGLELAGIVASALHWGGCE